MSLFNVYPLYDVEPVRASGMYVYDKNGEQYLDLYGGHAVISIGHSHPKYVQSICNQVKNIGFYSNAVQNTLQKELAEKLIRVTGLDAYQLFMCNSGAEANENGLKLASFHTGKKRVVAFKNSFHGRTSAAVAATDLPKIIAPLNAQQKVDFIELGDLTGVENVLKKGETCALIIECIQGVGGLGESPTGFYQGVGKLCKKYEVILIADEVQSGFGRTGDFFAFQRHELRPDIISIAKGMGNGFPVGAILIHPKIKAAFGMLGTTFGGNHLACVSALAVLDVLEEEKLMENASNMSRYFKEKFKSLKGLKEIKGRGLMLGLEFHFDIKLLKETLLYDYRIFTGSSKNPKQLRILPPLIIKQEHIDLLHDSIVKILSETPPIQVAPKN